MLQNSPLLVLLLYDGEGFISFSICLNLKWEANLGIEKHHGLKLKEIFVQPAVTWNPWALYSCRKKSILESIVFVHEHNLSSACPANKEWGI